jgi:1-acyl-sn-glycerol-3-phosphate acyltransferase
MLVEKIKNVWYDVSRIGCIIFCRCFLRLDVKGMKNVPKDGALLLVSNHQSYLDPIFCGLFLRRHLFYLGRDSLFRNKYFRLLSYSLNALSVRRDQADITAIKEIIERLKRGCGIVLYPEGTRTRDGRIAEFKPGAALLCKRGGAVIVPVIIDGAFECWPRFKKIFFFGSKVVVRYGKAITSKEAKKMSSRDLAAYLNDRLRQMQNEVRSKLGKKPFDYDTK